MNIAQILEQRGLSKQEALIYLKTLELGSAPATTIARHLGQNRVTVYSVLKKLCQKGIASPLSKGKTAYYSVLSPVQMAEKLQQKLQAFTEQIPLLDAIAHKYDNKPQVQYFEGIEGLKSIYENILTAKTSLRMFMGISYIHPDFKSYIDDHFVPERRRRQVDAKVIAPATSGMIDYQKRDGEMRREILLVPTEAFNFTNEITIYDHDKVALALFSEEEQSGLIIQSQNLAKSLSDIFDLLRKSLKK